MPEYCPISWYRGPLENCKESSSWTIFGSRVGQVASHFQNEHVVLEYILQKGLWTLKDTAWVKEILPRRNQKDHRMVFIGVTSLVWRKKTKKFLSLVRRTPWVWTQWGSSCFSSTPLRACMPSRPPEHFLVESIQNYQTHHCWSMGAQEMFC